MPPSELGRRFRMSEILEILAYERLEDEHFQEVQRQAELEAEAKAQRRKAMGE